MATEIWVNIGSGNGLLLDGTKPLPEPMLTDHQWSPVTFILGQFHKRCLSHQSLKSVWKLHVLKFHSNFPGANELNHICKRGPWAFFCKGNDRVMDVTLSKSTSNKCGVLTHWGRDKMAAISQTISSAFSSMKMFVLWMVIHWSLFLRVQLTISHEWFR